MNYFFNDLMNSWHHGKGSKFSRKGDFEKALKHFKLALKYVINSNNDMVIALEMECIARTLTNLDRKNEAIEYAYKSYNINREYEEVSKLSQQAMIRIKKMFPDISVGDGD